MKAKFQVVNVEDSSYDAKRGRKAQLTATILDLTQEGALKDTLDFEGEPEAMKDVKAGQVREVILTELRAGFGSRLRAKGTILPLTPAK